MSAKKTQEEFLKDAKLIHGDKYNYNKSIVNGSTSKIIIICPIHGEFEQIVIVHLKGHGCPACVKCKRLNKEDFLLKSNEVHNNKYDYSKSIITGVNKRVIILCPLHGEFHQTPEKHIRRKQGCPKCGIIKLSKSLTITKEEFIKRSNIKHNNKYIYNNTIFVKLNADIIITCPKHGDFKQRANHHIRGSGCPNCKLSKGEVLIKQILDKYNIKYEIQKKFKDCKINKRVLPYDFYLPEYNLCIEFNGEQHYKSIKHFGGDNDFNIRILYDQYKKQYCINNGIKYLEISYKDFNNIEEILKPIFNK